MAFPSPVLPATAGGITLQNALGQTMTLPNTLTLSGISRSRVTPTAQLASDGAVVTGARRYGPQSMTLEGSIIGATKELARAEVDALLAFVHAAPIKVRHFSQLDRFISVNIESAEVSWSRTHHVWQLAMSMSAPDPYWTADPKTFVQEVNLANANTVTIGLEGNAVTYPTVKITGRTVSGTHTLRPKLVNQLGEALEYIGTVEHNAVLTVDAARLTARKGTVSVLANMATSMFFGWRLYPGLNTLTLSMDPAASKLMKLELAYSERWY